MYFVPIIFADIINSLPWWGWGLLALIPPAIIALYFLKLKRQPLAVPSTYLWSRTIEDLHVNSLWQRLRQSLLLLLQLLLIILLAITLLRPGWKGTELIGHRFIFLIDKSASMGATDVGTGATTRLDEAKTQVKNLIEQMKTGDQAMVISFSSRAIADQSYTGDRKLLRTKVDLISQTSHTSDLNEALRAASGLANPGQTGDPSKGDVGFAEAMPATLYLFTDGRFAKVKNFRLGNLEPIFQKVGSETCGNVSIAAFGTGHHPDKPDKIEAFARIENFGFKAASMEASLYINNALADAQKVNLPARKFKVVKVKRGKEGAEYEAEEIQPENPTIGSIHFELARTAELEKDGILRLEIKPLGTEVEDHLKEDNKAYAVVSAPHPAKVLLVTPGNEALMLALSTPEANKVAAVSIKEPAKLTDKDTKKEMQDGSFDLVIFDQCAPATDKEMPACNTLFIGRKPPVPGWETKPKEVNPIFTDADQVHPLTQLVRMNNVLIMEATPITKGPQGMSVLLDFDAGPLYCVAPRAGYEDAFLAFDIYSVKKEGTEANTDWMRQRSFPVFIMNAVRYLGGVKAGENALTARPGMPATLRSETAAKYLYIDSPRGDGYEVPRETQNTFVFSKTDDIGVYDVREVKQGKISQKFAVNLFDEQESDIFPAYDVEIEHDKVQATVSKQNARQEIWKWLLMGAVGLLIFEWYIYNKRVYL